MHEINNLFYLELLFFLDAYTYTHTHERKYIK